MYEVRKLKILHISQHYSCFTCSFRFCHANTQCTYILVSVSFSIGFLCVWHGNLPNVTQNFPTQALSFAFKDKYTEEYTHGINYKKSWSWNVKCGYWHLTNYIKLIYISRMENKCFQQFKDLVTVLLKLETQMDFPGLHQGFGVSVQTIIVFRASYFRCFATIKLTSIKTQLILSFFIAQVVTTSSRMLSYHGLNAFLRGAPSNFLYDKIKDHLGGLY
uniref:ADP/ATP translocase n=1 Tax=Melopsittacus undulatus TaxID=13146 RepID=A0A8V5FNC8_MELUD